MWHWICWFSRLYSKRVCCIRRQVRKYRNLSIKSPKIKFSWKVQDVVKSVNINLEFFILQDDISIIKSICFVCLYWSSAVYLQFLSCTNNFQNISLPYRSGGCDTYELKESHVTQFPIDFGQHIFNRLDSAIIAYNHIKNCSGDSGLNLYNELFNPSGKCIKPRYTEDPGKIR